MKVSMIIVIFFLAYHVQEGAYGTIVQYDNYRDQNGVKGTHKDITSWFDYPLKSKWKHVKNPFL